MKTFPILVVAAVSILSVLPAQASPRELVCELLDSASGSLIDLRRAPLTPDSRDPILLLLKSNDAMATVRDVPGPGAFDRTLDLELSSRSGSESGVSRAHAAYQLDQSLQNDALATATLDVVDDFGFDVLLELRCFLREAPGVGALSSIRYDSGYGSASGFCSGMNGYWCLDQVKQRAREDAARDARFRCEMSHGKADTFMPSCSDFCNPFSIPADAQNQYVSCNSNCSIRCELP